METVNQKPGISLLIMIFLQFVTCIVIFFDIPVARQVIPFLYLTFVPGFVIVKILRMGELNGLETVLFSVGLSIAFLMLGGFLINLFGPLIGISQPLSLIPLMIIINSIILIGEIFVCLRGDSFKLWSHGPIEVSPFALLFMVLPVLSIVGAIYVNAYANNLLLLFMIIAISLLLIVGVLSKKLLPSKLYPFAILMIAIAILYHSSLISNYILSYGSDLPGEYFVFKITESNAHWNSILPLFFGIGEGRFNAMLSITILPTIYSILLKIDSTWMFKLLFPLIFAFVPLGLYQIWQTYVSKKYAFISAFLFMAQVTFYTEMLGLTREIIAELFFVLLLLVILNKKMKPVTKMICFMIFSCALVASHYAVAEIFLFFISFTLVMLIVLKRPNKNVTVPMIVFFFVVMFTWYIYTSSSATFNSFVEFGGYVFRQLGDFFNPASRGQTVLIGLGLAESPSIWNTISRIFAYLTQIFIVFGFVGLVTKRTTIRIEKEYFIFGLTAMAFLAILLLVPGLANTLNMARFYHTLLFFLAPFCVVGVVFIVKLLSKREKELAVSALLLVVLVPYFLFQTGFVYEVTRSDSYSIPLSGYRMDALRFYGSGYANAYSVCGAQWLSKNVVVKNSTLYAAETSGYVLTIYGMIPQVYVNELSNVTTVADNGVVYLSPLNVIEGVIPFGELSWNSSELSFIFDGLNIIYANGGSEIYKNTP
jgi:uncharacterized membrane protein